MTPILPSEHECPRDASRPDDETTTDNVIRLPRMRRIGEITREIIEWLEQGEGFKE